MRTTVYALENSRFEAAYRHLPQCLPMSSLPTPAQRGDAKGLLAVVQEACASGAWLSGWEPGT